MIWPSSVAGTSGSTIEVNKYDSYGVTATAPASRFQYTGQAAIPEIGLYYYKARMYNAALGRFMQTDPVGYEDDFNLYAYVYNDPLNHTDPTGQYAGVDDLIFAGTGALIGLAVQAAVDVATGSLSSWQDYAAAGVGGAVGGEAALYTLASGPGAIVAAGLAAGAATNLTRQTLHKLTDTPEAEFDAVGLAKETAIGGATALVPGAKVVGITAGRGSMQAVAKQMATKLEKGQISSVSAGTAAKMATASAVDSAGAVGAAVVTDVATTHGRQRLQEAQSCTQTSDRTC